jgi:ferredoxin
MAIRVNPKLIDELEHYGSEDVQNCYHCGNCSAVCPHADDVFVFPRKPMRFLQMGLEKKLERSLTPWLCYYCGQCSEQCPREAEPGETMMSMRRWLTSRYDFTGIAGLFYRSWKAELIAVILIALLTGAGFLFYGFSNGSIHIYDGPGAFLPSSMIHSFDLILMGILTALLATNALRMWFFIMQDSPKASIPWGLYLKNIYLLPVHFFTQKRYAQCEPESQNHVHLPWLTHLGLVFGYVAMLLIIVFFLDRLQAGPEIRWSVHVFGYLAGAGLLIGATYMIYGRLTKTQVQHRRSHSTDWMFLWLLFYMVVTGILQHILHRAGFIEAANIAYVIHLMGVVPWLLRMPFSKWAHLIYRPIAMYIAGIIKDARALDETPRRPIQHLQPAA